MNHLFYLHPFLTGLVQGIIFRTNHSRQLGAKIENLTIMDSIDLKQGSLNKIVGNFFILYFFLFFLASVAGHAIYDVFSNSLFDYEDFLGAFVMALVVAGLSALYFWDQLRDVFVLLGNDKLAVPRELNGSKEVIPCPSFRMDHLVEKLEQAGMIITYLDRNKNMLKIRQKLFFFNKCGAILHYDQHNKELGLISFSFSANKKRAIQFREELYQLLELPRP